MRFRLFSLLVFVASFVAVQTVSAQQDIPPADFQELQKWVSELGSDSYETRQAAMRSIWQSPWRSRELLEQLAEAADPEKVARIQHLIAANGLGVDTRKSPEISRLVTTFHQTDEEGKYPILLELHELGETVLAMNLIQSVDDQYVREYLFESIRDEGTDISLSILGNEGLFGPEQLAKLDPIMTHPLMWESNPNVCVAYLDIRSMLPQAIEEATVRCNGTDATGSDQLRLYEMLVYNKQFDRALEVIAKLEASEFERDSRRQSILRQAGRWQELAAEYNDDRIHAQSDATRAAIGWLVNHWAGNEEQAKLWQARMPQDEDDFSRNNTAYVQLCQLDLPEVLEAAKKMSPGKAFNLLCNLEQYELAFEVSGAPQSADERRTWYRRQLRTLGRKLSLTYMPGSDTAAEEAGDLFDLLESFAHQIGEFGDMEQSTYLYEQLCERLNQDDGWQVARWKRTVFYRLAQLQIGTDIWHFFELLKYDAEPGDAIVALFPDSELEAQIWLSLLESPDADTTEQLKMVANLLRSPFGDSSQQFDIDALIGVAKEQISARSPAARAAILQTLSNTCRIHRRFDLEREYALESSHLGNPNAVLELFRNAAKSDDWTAALRWAEQARNLEPDPLHYYFIAGCHQKLGNEELYEQNLATAGLLAPWTWNTLNNARDLRDVGLESIAVKLAERVLSPSTSEGHGSSWEHQNLADMIGQNDLQQALHHWRQAQLSWIGEQDNTLQSEPSRIQYFATQAAMVEAEIAINKKDFVEAERVLMRCNDVFSVAASTMLEKFMTLLENAGQQDVAERLFNASVQKFQRVLQQFPESALHNNNLAWTCAKCNRLPVERLAYARRAAELEPNNPMYLDTLADVLFMAGEFDEAIEIEERCIALNPFNKNFPVQLERFRNGKQ